MYLPTTRSFKELRRLKFEKYVVIRLLEQVLQLSHTYNRQNIKISDQFVCDYHHNPTVEHHR